MNHDSLRVAITGCSGFIGSHILTTLLNHNYRVRALIRDPSKYQISHPRLELISGNLDSKLSLNQLLENAKCVIHCAGRVRGISQAEFDQDNLIGTQNLLNACNHSGPDMRYIFISSLAARRPDLSYYAKSKHFAEIAVQNTPNLNWTIIRPPAVYGSGDKELTPVFDWMKKGILWIPANPRQTFSLIHVQDLVDLVHLQIHYRDSIHQILEPDDKEVYDWTVISELAAEFFQRSIRSIIIPKNVLKTAANLNVLISRLLGYSPMLTPSKLNELMHDDWLAKGVDSSSDWSPRIDLKTGLSTLYSLNN